MRQRQPDLGQALQQSAANLGSAVVQAFENLLVAGSVAGQTFQRTVLRQPPRQLNGPFKVDRRTAVTRNAKFQASPFRRLLARCKLAIAGQAGASASGPQRAASCPGTRSAGGR